MTERKIGRLVERTIILVVGPPRSGTSAISHVLSSLGVNFGSSEHFVDPEKNTHNPIFFELAALNALNDQVFGWFGRRYSDFDFLPLRGDFDQKMVVRFLPLCEQLIQSEFGEAPLVGLKDPRFCFLLPLWQMALDQLGYKVRCVRVERALDAVVASNARVNSTWSPEHNLRIASLSSLACAYFLDGQDAIKVNYDDALGDVTGIVRRLGDWLGTSPKTEKLTVASSVLQKSLRTFGQGVLHLPAKTSEICSTVRDSAEIGLHYAELAEFLRENGLRISDQVELADAAPVMRGPLSDGLSDRLSLMAMLAEVSSLALEVATAGHRVITDSGKSPKLDDLAQLYWRGADEAFDEARMVACPHDGLAEGQQLSFTLPAGGRCDFIRLDPSIFPGTFELTNLNVGDRVVGGIEKRVHAVRHISLFPASEDVIVFAGLDRDPQVELDVSDIGTGDGGSRVLNINVRRMHWREGQETLIREVARAGALAATESASGTLVSLTDEIYKRAVLTTENALSRIVSSTDDRYARLKAELADHSSHIYQQVLDLTLRVEEGERRAAGVMREALQEMSVALRAQRTEVAEHRRQLDQGLENQSRKLDEVAQSAAGNIKRHWSELTAALRAQQSDLADHRRLVNEQMLSLVHEVTEAGQSTSVEMQRQVKEMSAALAAQIESVRVELGESYVRKFVRWAGRRRSAR
jgi:hypothetical protein